MNFCLENKMKLLLFLLVKWYFIGLLASPVSQKDYEYEEYGVYDYGNIPADVPGAPDIDPTTICLLPPELDYNGIITPIFECKTLNRFETPPCNIYNYNGNNIDVCCPKPVTICIPGFRCASSLKCESKTSKKRKKIRECTECTADKGICKTCHLINGKEECTTVDERPYDCGQYDYHLDSALEDYSDYYENPEVSTRCTAEEGSECRPLSKCDQKSLSNPIKPPTYCGFNSQTGEDSFCCTGSGADLDDLFQPPIFKKPNGQSWQCEDQTEMCKKWAKDHPDSCNPGNEHYEFMKFACMESCQICKDQGCVDTFETCSKWAREGYCTTSSKVMMLHCRESCGTCGFKSVFNREPQYNRIGSKQYTDLDSPEFHCGDFKKRESNLTDGTLKNAERSTCTSVFISDRFVLTAGHCINTFDALGGKMTVELRGGTEYREVIASRRTFTHPLYVPPGTYHYDIAIIELERRILHDYTKYGDSPTCLNDKFDIGNEEAIIQGFGVNEFGELATRLQEAKVITATNENCTRWVKGNAKQFENAPDDQQIPYGQGYTFAELHDGINNGTLCSWGFQTDDGLFTHACRGDSGGPLYINTQKNQDSGEIKGQTLAGLLSGSGIEICGEQNIPNYWQRISEYLPWIKCVKRNAEENKTSRDVERACNQFVKRYTRECKKDESGIDIQTSCKQCEEVNRRKTCFEEFLL